MKKHIGSYAISAIVWSIVTLVILAVALIAGSSLRDFMEAWK